MSKDTSLEEIDIVKLLIYVLIFIVVCLVMIFAFIVPNIKDYREVQYQNRIQAASVTKINQIYNSKNSKLNDIKEKDRLIFKAFDKKFSEDNFTKFAKNYFNDVKLSQINNDSNKEQFFRYELNVTSNILTPTKFYNFIDALTKYDNIIKVDFPIQMRENSGKIHTTFNIKVYGLK
ncbi:hypothetical protein [Campylobacter sp. RM16192]|uniref:hypothetical protein n=1 Tax=Campylobacter sp. RM16192 TaxID=1660080 RepID=UPI001452709F|nr:hypothetical protein [Campylobacter sp. RM16192]QCD52044.1 hypothetical protein CDOMC_0391 [Campylobacter sp. RM16192]